MICLLTFKYFSFMKNRLSTSEEMSDFLEPLAYLRGVNT